MTKSSHANLYGGIASLALAQRRLLASAIGLTALCSVIAVLKPWPLKILADVALGQNGQRDSISLLLGFAESPSPTVIIAVAAVASLAVAALNTATDAGLAWTWTILGQRLARRLSIDVFARLLHMPLNVLRRFQSGDLLSRLSTDTWAISKLMNSVLITPATTLLTLGVMYFVSFRLDPELALYSAVTAPLMAIATVFFSRRIKVQNRQTREAQGRFASFVQQTLTAMPLVQVFDTSERNSKRLSELADEATTLTERGLLLTRSRALVTGLISVTGSALVLYVGAKKALAAEITVGTFLVFISYLRASQGALDSLLKLYGTFQPLFVGLERVFEILQSSREEVAAQPIGAGKRVSFKVAPSITFKNVSFSYRPECPVIDELSLHIRAGESVALVGASGAGKSTLLSLIPRLQDPDQGRVLIDGIDLREIELGSFREQIAYVFQETFLLRRSVRENIAYGRPGAEMPEIVAAARCARADDFIARLPEGYETVLAEGGATISGGEKQRLSTARACLRNASVLLLDEPTAACDAATEAELLANVRRLAEGRTVLIVAHRLSTIQWVDRIVVLDQGRVVESGTHHELIVARGRYFELVKLQSCENEAMEVAA
jgi:ATP-binding cassette, subfamily B, bacterial